MKKPIAGISGIVLASVTVYILLSIVSYLFTWKEDMGITTCAANLCGSLGYGIGRLFVSGCLGICSLAVPVILGAFSIRMIKGSGRINILKFGFYIALLTVILSVTLAYIGDLFSFSNAFCNGLGGPFGSFIAGGLEGLIGKVGTGLLLALIIICTALLCIHGLADWLSGKMQNTRDTVPAQQPAQEAASGIEPVTEVIKVQEPPQEPAPELTTTAATAPEKSAVKTVEPVEAEGDFEIIDNTDGLSTTVVEELKPIDNRLDPPDGLPKYKFPSLELLDNHSTNRHEVGSDELNRNNNKIRAVLANYRIQLQDVKAIVGPTVTLYKVYPAPGVKISDIKKLQEDIAISLGAKGVRVVTLSDSVGIEVANDYSSTVPLKALLNDPAFRESKADLPVAIGYTITQKVKVFDLADAPHLLVAGATKQGKSVGLNVIVSSLLYSRHPSELKFVFIDPKMVEFSAYGELLHHYLAVLPDSESEKDEQANAIVKTPKNAEKILRSLCIEMDERYELLSNAGVNNIKLYNAKYKERKLRPDEGHKFLPYIVVVVDEYADLTMTTGASPEARAASRSITNSIIRLAQKGRAAGLHVILATQRPSVDVISGVIKSNFPMRIAFRVASRVDSQTILDSPGAEKLIGRGDMLFSAGIDTERIQCGYVSGEEIDRVTGFVGEQHGYARSYSHPYYLPSAAEATGEAGGGAVDMTDLDSRFEEAARMVVTTQRGSTSDLQRKLGMGYAKAGRVMDQLEAAGIVGPQEGSKPRQVLVPDLDNLEEILKHFVK